MIDLKDSSGVIRVHLLEEEESEVSFNDSVIAVPLNEGSVHHAELMSSDYVTLKFSLEEPILFKRGTSAVVGGETFVLCNPYYPTYNATNGGYTYDIQLDKWYNAWNRYILKLNPKIAAAETTFDYTCRLGDHCELLYKSIREIINIDSSLKCPIKSGSAEKQPNISFVVHMDSLTDKGVVRTYGYNNSGAWAFSVGEEDRVTEQNTNYVKDEAKVISYQGDHIIDAFTKIAQTFECEWWAEGNETDGVVFHFGRCEDMSKSAIDWVFNEGVTEEDAKEIAQMSRNDSNDEFATRVYAYGSSTNVPSRYRKKLEFTATEQSSLTTKEEDWQYLSLEPISIMERSEASEEQLVEVTKTISFPSFKAAFDGTQQIIINIPYVSDFERRGSNIERIEQLDSVAKVNGSSLTISASPNSGIINIFGNITARKGEDCSVELSLAFLLFGDNAYARAELSFGNISIRSIGGKTSSYTLLRDKTRLMYPPYFRGNARSSQSAETYYFGSVQSEDGVVNKDGLSGEFGLFNTMSVDSNTKVRIAWNTSFFVISLNGDGATTEIDLIAYLVKGSEKTEIGSLGSQKYTFKDNKWTNSRGDETSVYEGEVTRAFTEGGTLAFGIRWKVSEGCSRPNLTNVVDNSKSIEIRIDPQNSKVSTTLTIVSDGKYNGVTIPCVLNANLAWDTDDAATWLAVESGTSANGTTDSVETVISAMVSGTLRYTLSNVKENDTPLSYFTNTDSSDSTIAGYKRRLMLPINLCPQNYVQSTVPSSEIVETEVVFDDIYPSKNLRIEKVETFTRKEEITDDDGHQYKVDKTWYRIFINKDDFPFDKDYISSQATLSCFFASGKLAGMTFEMDFEGDSISKGVDSGGSVHTLQSYVIMKREDGNIDLPNSTLCPKVGDEVAMINYDPLAIDALTLVEDAERRLYEEAMNYLKKVSKDCGTYTITLNSGYAYGRKSDGVLDSTLAKRFKLGERISITHGGFFEGTRTTRIIGLETKLDIPYDAPQYTLGESAAYSRLSDLETKIKEASSATSSTSVSTYSYGGGGGDMSYNMVFSADGKGFATYNPMSSNMVVAFKAGSGVMLTPDENDHSLIISSSGKGGDMSNFDELFEKVTLEDGTIAIKAKYGLFSVGFVSAYGENQDGGGSGGGSSYQRLDSIKDYTPSMDSTHVLGAKVAQEIKNIENKVDALELMDSDKHLVVNHQVAEKTWNVTHNLGKMPSVTVITSDGVCVVGEVKYIDENSLTLTFGCEFSGKVILN